MKPACDAVVSVWMRSTPVDAMTTAVIDCKTIRAHWKAISLVQRVLTVPVRHPVLLFLVCKGYQRLFDHSTEAETISRICVRLTLESSPLHQ